VATNKANVFLFLGLLESTRHSSFVDQRPQEKKPAFSFGNVTPESYYSKLVGLGLIQVSKGTQTLSTK